MASLEMSLPILGASGWFEEDPAIPGLAGAVDLSFGKPCLDFLEPMQRRRLSPLARGVFHCAGRTGPGGDFRIVFASRHGEAERTLTVLQDIAAGAEVSPILFSISVHNAVPGLFSILGGNKAPVSALAAGAESLGYGLLEAFTAWKSDPSSPVLFLFGEDRVPDTWAPCTQPQVPHALAFLVGEGGRELRMTWDPAGRRPEPEGIQSFRFLASLGNGAPRAPWAGPTASWDWRLA